MVEYLPLVAKNSIRNARRTILTVSSVATSLCLLGILMALYRGFFLAEAPEHQAHRLIVRNKVSLANPLLLSYLPLIRKVPGVQEASVYQVFPSSYKDNTPSQSFARFGIEPERLSRLFPEFQMSDAEKKAFVNERTAAIIGIKSARLLGMKLGDRVTLAGEIHPVTLELVIRGIFNAGTAEDESLYFHYDYLNESLAAGQRDQVSSFMVRMVRPEIANAVIKGIDDQFRNAPLKTKTETEKAFQLTFLAMLGNVKAFLWSICVAVTFTILLVTGNTMAMAVRERTREVGVLKTLGFTPDVIVGLLVGEALALSLAGGVIGLSLAKLVCDELRNGAGYVADFSQLYMTGTVFAAGLGISVSIGCVSSVIPAYLAARLPILEALRTAD
jgi:putative ABC transport system permease protein